MTYHRVNPVLWDNEQFLGLDDLARCVWLLLLTGPQVTVLPGLQRASAATLADALQRDPAEVRAAIVALERAGLVQADERRRLIRIPRAPKHNPAESPNHIRAWWRRWQELPSCDLRERHLETLREHASLSTETHQKAWDQTFGSPSEAPSEPPPKPRTPEPTAPPEGPPEAPSVAPPEGPPEAPPEGACEACLLLTSPAYCLLHSGSGTVGRGLEEPTLRPASPGSAPADPPKPLELTPETQAAPKAKRPRPEPRPDVVPEGGTVARAAYDAIVGDELLRPIVAGPGDWATRSTVPEAYPGVNIVAEVRRAGEWLARGKRRIVDGRQFLSGWMRRAADDLARTPKPAGPVAISRDIKPLPPGGSADLLAPYLPKRKAAANG